MPEAGARESRAEPRPELRQPSSEGRPASRRKYM